MKATSGANRRSRSQQPPAKVLVLIGASDRGEDTQLIRHFVLEILRSEMNLNIQRISGTTRRTAAYFKSAIYEGSQHTSVEKNFKSLFNNLQNSQEHSSDEASRAKNSQKLLFFEDIDIIFEDEQQD